MQVTEPECDLMLNITNEPPPSTTETPNKRKNKREPVGSSKKRVRFSEQQGLYDINTTVLQDASKADVKNSGFLNNGFFDMKTIDRIDFRQEVKDGLANSGYDMVQESVDVYAQGIDAVQAEIENDINEKKVGFIGELASDNGNNESTPEGVKLKYRLAKLHKSPSWLHRQSCLSSSAKKSYSHLIQGDIILQFKNTNLHEIRGYAAK